MTQSRIEFAAKIRRGECESSPCLFTPDWSAVSCIKGISEDTWTQHQNAIESDFEYEHFSDIFRHLPLDCPDAILARQLPLQVIHWGFDGKLHSGIIVVDHKLSDDVLRFFQKALELHFPIKSVIPASAERFEDTPYNWSDELTMEAGNSSAFNFRFINGDPYEVKKLSLHAFGFAIDINPDLSPCLVRVSSPASDSEAISVMLKRVGYPYWNQNFSLYAPKGSTYDPTREGTLYRDHPLVTFMIEELGWSWGGEWDVLFDPHHFQKIPKEDEEWVLKLGGTLD